jgi:hypothetical protein
MQMYNGIKKIFTQGQTITVDANTTVSMFFTLNPEKPLFLKNSNVSLGTSTTINYIKVDSVDVGNNASIDFESRFGGLPAVEREIEINLTNSDSNAHDTVVKIEGLIVK